VAVPEFCAPLSQNKILGNFEESYENSRCHFATYSLPEGPVPEYGSADKSAIAIGQVNSSIETRMSRL
jgi:hypothetical protein